MKETNSDEQKLNEIKHLAQLTQEPSYTMPKGLSHEERREWVKKLVSKIKINKEKQHE